MPSSFYPIYRGGPESYHRRVPRSNHRRVPGSYHRRVPGTFYRRVPGPFYRRVPGSSHRFGASTHRTCSSARKSGTRESAGPSGVADRVALSDRILFNLDNRAKTGGQITPTYNHLTANFTM